MAKTKITTDQQLEQYTNAEQVVGTWVDGSTLYRKAWDKGSVSDYPFAHGITGLQKVVRFSMAIRDSGNTSWRHLPWLYSLSDANWVGGAYVDSTNVIFQDNGTTAIDDFTASYVILEYTRT